jgi:CheY-like chemotaxis protein
MLRMKNQTTDSDVKEFSGDPAPVTAPAHSVVTTLFTARGLVESEWRSTLAGIIGGSYSTAQRRLASEDQFTIGELRAIAGHFGTTVSLMLKAAYADERKNPDATHATLKLGDHKFPCIVVTRTSCRSSAEALVTYEGQDGEIYVTPVSDAEPGKELRAVSSIEIQPPKAFRIAVLDDVLSAAVPVVQLLNGRGFEATAYTTAPQVQALLAQAKRPDGYVLDWTLDGGQNSRSLIRSIRDVDSQCPIFLLTGTIQQANEGEISEVVQLYRVQVHVKPARTVILAASLRSLLEDGQEPIQFTPA